MHLSIILNLKISKGKYSFKVFSAYTMNIIYCKEHNSKIFCKVLEGAIKVL